MTLTEVFLSSHFLQKHSVPPPPCHYWNFGAARGSPFLDVVRVYRHCPNNFPITIRASTYTPLPLRLCPHTQINHLMEVTAVNKLSWYVGQPSCPPESDTKYIPFDYLCSMCTLLKSWWWWRSSSPPSALPSTPPPWSRCGDLSIYISLLR